MKTLKERRADRAKRVIENAQQDGNERPTGLDRVGGALAHVTAATAAVSVLSDDEKRELQARLGNELEPTKGYADKATFPLAGIGVVNPFVVSLEQSGLSPVEVAGLSALSGSGEAPPPEGGEGGARIAGGEHSGNGGNTDPASVSPGDALSAAVASAAWGTGAPADTSPAAPAAEAGAANPADAADETVNEDGTAKTKKELAAILDARGVTYESDANHGRLTELVKANPAS